MFDQIDQKKELLDSKRPLPKYTIKSLREKLLLEWTYHSDAIEGNTLTINETKVGLEGIKTLREHLEVIDHREAIAYVEEMVHKEETLSEGQIKHLHRIVRSRKWKKGMNDDGDYYTWIWRY